MRGDEATHVVANNDEKFQFTPLREGRQSALGIHRVLCRFNSRPCVRGDAVISNSGGISKFQFTPLREGRPHDSHIIVLSYAFQFTPLREGRPFAFRNFSATSPFQFTPLREGRQYQALYSDTIRGFNSRPCVRGDHKKEDETMFARVSIHAPA